MSTKPNLPNRPEPHRERRGHDFWPPEAMWQSIPKLYATDGPGSMRERIIQLHYFCGGSDWWVIEADPVEGIAFGYVCLNGDTQSAEWGYVNLTELAELYLAPWLIVERDLHWTPLRAGEVLPPGAF